MRMSGVIPAGSPSRKATANSFWKWSFIVEPRSAPSPAMVATPRRKPRVVRRSMSETLPVKSSRPSSEARTASTGSPPRSRARRTAAPIRVARVTDPRIAWSLISRPVRGAFAVAAMEPTSVTATRPSRSCHCQLAARSTITTLSRTSARQKG